MRLLRRRLRVTDIEIRHIGENGIHCVLLLPPKTSSEDTEMVERLVRAVAAGQVPSTKKEETE